MSQNVEMSRIIQALRGLKSKIGVSSLFHTQMNQIKLLLRNDTTGFINTILDFMIHAGSVPMKIETSSASLNSNLLTWQKTIRAKSWVICSIFTSNFSLAYHCFQERF